MEFVPVVMTSAWLPAIPAFLIAGIVTTACVPLSMTLARRIGAVATPDTTRHLHLRPTPQLGGLAMAVGFLVVMLVFHGSIHDGFDIAVALVVITGIMAVDDILELPWWSKLLAEVAVGLIIALGGVAITFVAIPGGGNGADIIKLGIFAIPITVLWVVGMQNSINLLDGSDGVAAGVVAIVAVVCMAAAISRFAVAQSAETGVVVMSGALLGVCLGFLIFNLPPAQVFMGDSGSQFLGTAIAVLTILGVAKLAVTLSLIVPLIALGLPIGDTAAAIIRRKWSGRGIMEADAGHLHHRLRALGLSPMETALTFYLLTALLGCVSLIVLGNRVIVEILLFLLVVALAIVWGRLYLRTRQQRTTDSGVLELSGRRNHTTTEPDGRDLSPHDPGELDE